MATRHFCASFSVRIGTRRVRFELAPAPEHGGPEGFFRVRADRRWCDDAEGRPRFLERGQVAALVVDAALGVLPDPAMDPAPVLPPRTRVSVNWELDGIPHSECGWTVAPPVRAAGGSGPQTGPCSGWDGTQGDPADGLWLVPVVMYGKGVVYVPVTACIWR